jgi:hypothetical protein
VNCIACRNGLLAKITRIVEACDAELSLQILGALDYAAGEAVEGLRWRSSGGVLLVLRRETRANGCIYWYAYRLHDKLYVGTELSQSRLEQLARRYEVSCD